MAFAVFTRRDWDAHLRCWGVRWCGICGEAAEYGKACRLCRSRQTPAKRARNAVWWAKQRDLGTETYARDKARKRRRYLTDPAYAAKQKRVAA